MIQATTWFPEHEITMLSPQGFEMLLSQTLTSIIAVQKYQLHQDFLNRIHTIMSSDSFLPINRFYAQYLLLRLLEKTEEFFNYQFAVHKDLVRFIQETAQYQFNLKRQNNGRGNLYFNQLPSRDEIRIGINFVRLSLEILIFLQQKYKPCISTNPWKSFLVENTSFQKKIQQYSFFYFLNKDYDLSQDLATWNFAGDDLPSEQKPTSIKLQTEEDLPALNNDDEENNHEDVPYISSEFDLLMAPEHKNQVLSVEDVEESRSPRLIKNRRFSGQKLTDVWKQEMKEIKSAEQVAPGPEHQSGGQLHCDVDNILVTYSENLKEEDSKMLKLRQSITKTNTDDNQIQLKKTLANIILPSQNSPKINHRPLNPLILSSEKSPLNYIAKPRFSFEVDKPMVSKKMGSSLTPFLLPSEKAVTNFTSAVNSPRNKFNSNKVTAELLEISKSIDRSKNQLSGFYSPVSKKKENESNFDFSPQKEKSKRLTFSSIFSEKQATKGMDFSSSQVISEDSSRIFGFLKEQKNLQNFGQSKFKQYSKNTVNTSNIILWKQERAESANARQTKNLSSDQDLSLKKGIDPFSKNQHNAKKFNKDRPNLYY